MAGNISGKKGSKDVDAAGPSAADLDASNKA